MYQSQGGVAGDIRLFEEYSVLDTSLTGEQTTIEFGVGVRSHMRYGVLHKPQLEALQVGSKFYGSQME